MECCNTLPSWLFFPYFLQKNTLYYHGLFWSRILLLFWRDLLAFYGLVEDYIHFFSKQFLASGLPQNLQCSGAILGLGYGGPLRGPARFRPKIAQEKCEDQNLPYKSTPLSDRMHKTIFLGQGGWNQENFYYIGQQNFFSYHESPRTRGPQFFFCLEHETHALKK